MAPPDDHSVLLNVHKGRAMVSTARSARSSTISRRTIGAGRGKRRVGGTVRVLRQPADLSGRSAARWRSRGAR